MIECRYCETEIIFSDLHINPSGKKIPLNLNETPHRCNGWLVQNRKYYPCRKCQKPIYFDDHQKTDKGKWIPISKSSGLPHQCDN
ncbi:MAG TPA: hypothetical protein VKA95_06435 [Nitrososphaeraceae archaeon]|nr:hypothetical protein [Nitrososphaeraceae archaeon]